MRKCVLFVVLLSGCTTCRLCEQPRYIDQPCWPAPSQIVPKRIAPPVIQPQRIPPPEYPVQGQINNQNDKITKDGTYWKSLACTVLGIWAAGSVGGFAKSKIRDAFIS